MLILDAHVKGYIDYRGFNPDVPEDMLKEDLILRYCEKELREKKSFLEFLENMFGKNPVGGESFTVLNTIRNVYPGYADSIEKQIILQQQRNRENACKVAEQYQKELADGGS
jgi:hypothetical protein